MTRARLLQEWVSTHAERRPDATAVVLGGEQLTYGAMDVLSNQIAHALRSAGCRRGDRVGLLLPKSPVAVASLLGVLKADACYVPLDVDSPAPRLAKIVASAGPRIILSSSRGAASLQELLQDRRLRSIGTGWLEAHGAAPTPDTPRFTIVDVRRCPAAPPASVNSPDDLAHILFTSGSTGMPKGVMITHANVAAFVEWANSHFALSPADRMSGHSPFHFDLSTFDLFGTFAAGAQVHLVPPELNVVPHHLADFIRQAELTQWFSVPSVLALMAQLDVVRHGDFPTLQRLLWCGEVFSTPALRYWMQRLPHVTFTNLYGPTEATIASSYYTVPACPARPTDMVPIGSACAGEELRVLDERGRAVRPGETGELYIGGVGLSPGYWQDAEKTAAAFVSHPAGSGAGDRLYRTGDLARLGEDGVVYFLGRIDAQIKSRGYRIELGEIEAALQTLPDLEECAVVALPSPGFEGMTICCAYVPRRGASVTPLTLRRQLGTLLPAYMLPSRWRAYDRLARNANGKIDRRRIRDEWERDAVVPVRQS